MPKEIRYKKGFSPGQLYSEIITEEKISEEEHHGNLTKEKNPRFVQFCKRAYQISPSLGRGAKFKEEYKNAIAFLRWDLSPEEFAAATKLVLLGSLIIGVLAAVLALFVPGVADFLGELAGPAGLLIAFGIPALIAAYLTNFIQTYPLNAVKAEQREALTYVPEMMGYLIMSLKLTPNLEKGIEFASKNGKGKIAEDFQKLLWDIQLGLYDTIAVALDELAYKWGKYSSEFKQSLMMVRASILEDTEAKRYALLDKTMENVLDSIRNKMEQYARALSQPSIMLFYIGVMLPLILIIILPVGSAFTGSGMAQPINLIFIYNILIPLVAFLFARKVIKTRPPTYETPIITDDFPGLPPKWKMKIGKTQADLRVVIGIVFIVGLLLSTGISIQGIPPKLVIPEEDYDLQLIPADQSREQAMGAAGLDLTYFDEGGQLYVQFLAQGLTPEQAAQKVNLEQAQFFNSGQNDITPYNLVFGLILTLAICFYLFFYHRNYYKRKAQLEIVEMETEFKDSLYVLASRLGENRPVEEALEHTRTFLPNLIISERIFGRTVDNIRLMSLPLEEAVFHKSYGSLKNIPSKIIHGGMKIMVDSVQLGVNVAAKTLISLSLQLENSEKVNKMMRDLISDISNMMITMATLIAPLVLGITTALQKIVMVTLASIVGSSIGQEADVTDLPAGTPLSGGSDGGITGNLLKPDAFSSMVTPFEFLIIVAIYVIELVIIMTYYVTMVQEDNDLLFKMNLAKMVPIALVAFLISVIVSNVVISGFGGG